MAEATEKPPTYRWFVLVMTGVASFVALGLGWMAMPVLFHEISVKLNLSFPQLMTTWGIIPIAVLLSSIPSGILGDRFGVRLTCGVGLLLCGIFGALRGTATSFTTLAIFMFLYGISFPLGFVNFVKALGMWFPPRQMGMAIGLREAFFGVGGALSLMFSGTVVSPALGGWHMVMYVYGTTTSIIGIVWLLFIRERKVAIPTETSNRNLVAKRPSIGVGYSKVLRSKNVWFLILINFMFMGGWLGASGSLPFLLEQEGWPTFQAHFVVSLVLWMFVLGCVILPTLSDRIGFRRIVYASCLIPAGVGMFGCFFLSSPWIWVAAVIWGFFAGAIPLIMAIPMELPEVGSAMAGSALGLIMAAGNIGGFIFPLIAVPLATIGYIWVGVLCGVIGYSGTALVIWGIRETGEKTRAG